ncbi:hypothetical protein, partial [uncultured Selenomonas sp.]|uniref:hypothetical protein n=1 Tax=uncultured Selenomonas sp. TaxID=159275 RepID=UPI0028EDCA4C
VKHAASVRPEPGSNSPKKNLVFFRYATSRLRRVSSAHTSALPGRDFAVPCLAKKSLRFFSTSNMVALDAENFAFSLQRAMIGSFYLWIRFFRTA